MNRSSLRGRSRNREVDPVTFDFAPMVDVVLLLVIFFMLASNLVSSQSRALPIDLPSASRVQSVPPNIPTVSVSKTGVISLEGVKQVSLFALEQNLRSLAKKSGGLVSLQADKAGNYGRVVAVMDTIKKAGGQRLAIATK